MGTIWSTKHTKLWEYKINKDGMPPLLSFSLGQAPSFFISNLAKQPQLSVAYNIWTLSGSQVCNDINHLSFAQIIVTIYDCF